MLRFRFLVLLTAGFAAAADNRLSDTLKNMTQGRNSSSGGGPEENPLKNEIGQYLRECGASPKEEEGQRFNSSRGGYDFKNRRNSNEYEGGGGFSGNYENYGNRNGDRNFNSNSNNRDGHRSGNRNDEGNCDENGSNSDSSYDQGRNYGNGYGNNGNYRYGNCNYDSNGYSFGYGNQNNNNNRGNNRGYYDSNYGNRNPGNNGYGGSYGGGNLMGRGQGQGGSWDNGGGAGSPFFRGKRSSEGSAQCVSQCVFGYLEVLDDNRVPSETLLIKWLQDHLTNDIKRIRALREARRCFARLATTDTEDGCEFSKSLSNCLDLDVE